MELFGRDDELGRIDRVLTSIRSRSARLSIEGEAGIGKTALWRAAIDRASALGYAVLTTRPSQADRSLTYAGLTDLVGDLEPRAFAALPDPQRRALDAALLRAIPTGGVPDRRAVFTAFRSILATIATDAPVVVAVDDVQWLDTPTLRALDFAGRRLPPCGVGVVTATRVQPGGAAAVALEADEHMPLAPLAAMALRRVIESQLGRSLLKPTLLRLHRACAGNAFYALEIAAELIDKQVADDRDVWPIPDDVRELVDRRVTRLPPSIREQLLLAAAASHPTADLLEPSARQAVSATGLVAVEAGGRLRFAHPLYASAVYLAASPEQRRRAHRRLAAGEPDVQRRARHLALAAVGPDEEIARQLDEAAARARARGAPEVAADLQERAIELTPPHRVLAARRRALAAADHAYHGGLLQRARTLLTPLVEGSDDGDLRSRALRLLGLVRFREENVAGAVELLRAAADAAGDDSVLRAPVELELAFAAVSASFDFSAAVEHADRALAHAQRLDDRGLLAQALAVKAIAGFLVDGADAGSLLAEALELEDPAAGGSVEVQPSLIAGCMGLYAGDLDRARSLLYPLCSRLRDAGQEADLCYPLTVIAWVECWAGDLAAAERAIAEAIEIATVTDSRSMMGLVHAHAAFVAAYQGRVAGCRAHAEAALAGMEETGFAVHATWSLSALALLELSLGNPEAALDALAPLLAFVERDPPLEPIRVFFLADLIEALSGAGQVERAERLTAFLRERGDTLARPWAQAAALRSQALLEAAAGDQTRARRSIDEAIGLYEQLAMPLELARALIVSGRLHRRAKRKADARQALEAAQEICERIGATLWAARAAEERARVGDGHGADRLTPSEARIAQLAAAGLTNREVASAAFVSHKTVEANLSRIYRKLGIRSRAELGVRLEQSGDSTDATPR